MKHSVWLMLFGLLLSVGARAAEPPAMSEVEKERIRVIVKEAIREYAASLSDKQQANSGAKDILREINQSNRNFMRTHGPAHFGHFAESQHPRATVVTCSDSRVHTHALDATPDGDLFMVRNIGNQIATAEGSVEYGVHHLHTPLLLIVGHVACGAIKAASGDYSKESTPIQRELDTIQIPKGDAGLNSVKLNINNQVRLAMSKFEEDVIAGRLTVIGAVYDFKNEMRQGMGKLNIVNVNGETNGAKIAKLDLMQGLDAPAEKPAVHAAPKRRAPPKPAKEDAEPEKAADKHADKPAEKTAEKPAKHKEGH
jgi:carbonic anhydrase